ncbi:MAG: hypothetical protein E7637_04590 [Ruminococcaceae bacterium]|nr:hypothetical protein [Oscillospiraceae bacterium]
MKRRGTKTAESRLADVREQASEILSENGNRLMLIEALGLCLLTVPLYVALHTLCMMGVRLLPQLPLLVWEWILAGLIFFLTLLVTLPLLYGVARMASCMERGEEVSLSDLFAPFTSGRRYFYALHASFHTLRLLSLVVLMIWMTESAIAALIVDPVLAWGIGVLCFLAEAVIGICLLYGQFPLLAVTVHEECDADTHESLSALSASSSQRYASRFFGGFFFRILLGVLSFGILLLWDVIPLMLVSYFRYCRRINDNDDLIGG